MPTTQFLEDGDWPQSRRGLQHDDDLSLPDIGERIGASTPTRRQLLRGKPGILVEPISGGGTEAGLDAGHASRVRISILHEEPHLTIGDMGAGQKDRSSPREKPTLHPPATTAKPRRFLGEAVLALITVGLRPSFIRAKPAHSHPDCRWTLILIVAPHQRLFRSPGCPTGR